MSDQPKNIFSKILKGLGITLGVLILLVITARLLLKTQPVHKFAKNKIVEIANNNLNGSLQLGTLSGDLWNEAILSSIQLSGEDGNTIVTADSLVLRYEVLTFLTGPYTVNEVALLHAQINVTEEDSVFNVQKLAKESESEESSGGMPAFLVDKIRAKNINTEVRSPAYLPDTTVTISNLNARASLSNLTSLSANLESLEFKIDEGRLPEPVSVNTAASYGDSTITLNQLVVETSRSLLKSQASFNMESSSVDAELSTEPVSLQDIDAYLDKALPADKILTNITLGGKLSDLNLDLNISSTGVGNLEMSSNLNVDDTLMVHHLELSGDYLNVAYFTNDSVDAETGPFSFRFDGSVSSEIEASNAQFELKANDVRFQEYRLKQVAGNGEFKENNLSGEINIHTPFEEKAFVKAEIAQLLSEQPDWDVEVRVQKFNLANWMEGDGMQSDIHALLIASGTGFELPDSGMVVSLSNRNRPGGPYEPITINETPVEVIELEGTVGTLISRLEGRVSSNKNELNVNAEAQDVLSEVPSFNYRITTKDFDLSRIPDFGNFPTSVNLILTGNATGMDPETMTAYTDLEIEKSALNGAYIDSLIASTTLDDGILTISEGELKSDLADGEFDGRKNITNYSDPLNRLNLDLIVKQIQPLAPLVNAEELKASGKISGNILQDTSGVLTSDFTLNLENIQFDSLFIAQSISGETRGTIKEVSEFETSLNIGNPVITGLVFEDIDINSSGVSYEDSLTADFKLNVVGSERGNLVQQGDLKMYAGSGRTEIKLDVFDFITPASELTLQQPFNIHLNPESVETDTLYLLSTSGAFMQMAVPYADSVRQEAWLNGRDFDFGLIQDVLFGHRYLDGILSGNINYDNDGEAVSGNGNVQLMNIEYEEVTADSLKLDFGIKERRLKTEGNIYWDNSPKISLNLDVPFLINEPDMTESALKAEVSGGFSIYSTPIDKFKPLMEGFNFDETSGDITFEGTLSGTAENPVINASSSLNNPVLSGIKLDSVTASLNYNNGEKALEVNADLLSKGETAANIEVIYPISYDFRAMEFSFPDDDDIISAVLKSEKLNLAIFDDFLDPNFLSGLNGLLYADITLKGPVNELKPEGYLNFYNGSVSVKPAGITISKITSEIAFQEDQINLKKMSASSGKGSFNMNGKIALDGLSASTIDMKANASQFKIANTDDYNLVIDLNSNLTGPAQTPKASGSLSIKNGFVYLQDFGDKTVEEVQLEGEEEASFSPYDSLSLDMEINIERNFFVRNRNYLDMELEFNGSLDAQKQTNQELQLFGAITGTDGYVRPLGKQFNMEEADFTFSGPVDNPEIYVKSVYTPPTRQKGEVIELFYLIEGTADDPEFKFDSNPPMEQQDIICYTLFSMPCYSLDNWQSVFAGENNTTAADVLTDVLLDEVEALATRELGVDVVQIDNSSSGSNSGTSIKTGWYLNDRTFFAIVNEITSSSPKTLFILEYILNEQFDLILTQGDDARQGVDVRFQYDY